MAHPNPAPLIFENVTFTYPNGVTVLENLDFEVAEGECLGLIGPSGEGKTTVLKLAAGLLTPTKGKVLLNGNDLQTLAGGARREALRKLGMTFQSSGLFDSMTSAENLLLVLNEHTKGSKADKQSRLLKALSEVGLEGIENKLAHELSGGMRKRLGIARALLLEPSIVLSDEPTAGLDPITSRSICDLLASLRQKHHGTMLVVMSDTDHLFSFSDRVAFLYKGTLRALAPTAQIRASQDAVVKQFVNGSLEGPLTPQGAEL